jgi:hypothetical protein
MGLNMLPDALQKVPSPPLAGERARERGADRRFTLSPPPLPSRERGVLFVADFFTHGIPGRTEK